MHKYSKVIALVIALLVSAGSFSGAAAQVPPTPGPGGACDITGTVNGSAVPTSGTVGTTIQFRPTGFSQGEQVSFFITLPDGRVIGTARPVELPVNPDGSIGPLPFSIDQRLVDLATGRYAITFVGATSNNTSVIYFCVRSTAQATASAQVTNTPVPPAPTNTSAPTSTSVPATATAPAATATSEATAPAATSTSMASVTTQPTTPPVSTPTAMPTLEPTLKPIPTAAPLPTTMPPGMPRTGTGSSSPVDFGLLALVSMSLLGFGLIARRRMSNTTR